MDEYFIMTFKDRSRTPLRFFFRAYHQEGSKSGWYVYPDRNSKPVFVKDSEIEKVEPE